MRSRRITTSTAATSAHNFGTMPHAAIRLTGPQSSGRSFQQISWWMGV
jgi:hypothetical protein